MDWVAQSLLGKVHGGIPGKEIRAVWQEYEDSETEESKFVHDVDKIELILQMVEYERASNCEVDLSEFSWVARKIYLDEMKVWAQEILDERDQLWKSKHMEPREPTSASSIKKQQDQYYGNGKVEADANTETNGDADSMRSN